MACALPGFVSAQPKPKRVAVMWLMFDRPSTADERKAYEARFEPFGFQAGKNLEIQWYEKVMLNDRSQSLDEILSRMVGAQPDCIIAAGEPVALGLQKLTSTIPIVTLLSDADPVELGIARSVSRPGANFTGIYSASYEVNLKRMEILKRLVPGLSCVGWIAFEQQLSWFPIFEKAATAAGLRVRKVVANAKDGPRFEKVRREVAELRQAGCLAAHFHSAVPTLVEEVTAAARASRLVLSYTGKSETLATEGLFFSYQGLLSAAGYKNEGLIKIAVRILRGERVGDIAFEGPVAYELRVNRKTARRFGVEIPAEILVLADEIID
jgi:putative ABC transport system substrate-binding protein